MPLFVVGVWTLEQSLRLRVRSTGHPVTVHKTLVEKTLYTHSSSMKHHKRLKMPNLREWHRLMFDGGSSDWCPSPSLHLVPNRGTSSPCDFVLEMKMIKRSVKCTNSSWSDSMTKYNGVKNLRILQTPGPDHKTTGK